MLVWRRWVFPLLMVVVFGVIAAALAKIAFFPDQQALAEQPSVAMQDPVVSVERGSLVNELEVTGTIARDEAVPLKADVEGAVTEVLVGNGQQVAAGQPLFRVKRFENSKIVDLVAPFAGTVGDIALVSNQGTSIGLEYAKLTPPTFHVLGTIEPVQLYRLLNAPTEASVTIAGGPAPFTCTGLTVQVADDATTSVRCAVPADQTVFAGLPATIGIAVGAVDDALVIPVTAVRGGGGSGLVWVDDGSGQPVETRVALGVNDGTMVEVVDGLTEGAAIRQYVPGAVAPLQENCYEIAPGEQYCESGVSW